MNSHHVLPLVLLAFNIFNATSDNIFTLFCAIKHKMITPPKGAFMLSAFLHMGSFVHFAFIVENAEMPI